MRHVDRGSNDNIKSTGSDGPRTASAWKGKSQDGRGHTYLDEAQRHRVNDRARRTSSGSCTGEFMSLTTGRRLGFQRIGQRDLLIMLDVDYRTVDLSSGPIAVQIHDGDQLHECNGDVSATSIDGVLHVFKLVADETLTPSKLITGRISHANHPILQSVFKTCSRQTFKNSVLLKNSKWVHAAASALDLDVAAAARKLLLRHSPPCKLAQLTDPGRSVHLRNAILGLVAYREVAIDLSSPISGQSEVVW